MDNDLGSAPALLCVGLNHETTPIEVRDALVMNDSEVEQAIRALRDRCGAHEALVLSTCNRTEVYARGVALPDPRAFVASLLTEIKGLDLKGNESRYLYAYDEPDSIRHLYRVACGLDSMVLGEQQILGQVKAAMHLAARLGGSGPVTERLFESVLHCAKRARSETGIGRGPVSSSFAAVNLAAKVLGRLGEKRVLVIGAGEIASLAARHFRDAGVLTFVVANRSRDRAGSIAAELCARVVSLEGLPVILPGADIVVSATSSPGLVLEEAAVRQAMRIRRNRPLLLLDLAVPRDIDPAAGKLPNVFLHDLDALGAIVVQSLDQRRAEIPKVEAIIDAELSRFVRWHRSLAVKPTLRAFRTYVERIAEGELERHRGRFRPEDQDALRALTHGIVQKLLHRPTVRLTRPDGEDVQSPPLGRIEAIRDLFGIDDTESNADREPR